MAPTPTVRVAWSDGAGFDPVSFEEALEQTTAHNDRAPDVEITHAAHCLVWARDHTPIVGLDKDKSHALHPRAAVLMHVRFDGMIGFPGGKIDDAVAGLPLEEARTLVVDALNRELVEESNYDIKGHALRWSDHIFTHTYKREITQLPIYTHFFARELSLEVLQDLERRSLASHEHGREVKGNCRVPLHTMLDGYRGLPAFLDNNFIGNARRQLCEALPQLGLVTAEEVREALGATRRKM